MKLPIGLLCFLSLLFGSISYSALVEEKEIGTKLEDGTIAGENEALAHFQKYEPEVFTKLKQMKPSAMQREHAEKFYWFQRVGNYRKVQKCEALHQLQVTFHLPETKKEKCISNIMETHVE